MRVLLFTHEQDIDGMGSILVGKYSFNNFDYITCKTFEVNNKVLETINSKIIYEYDKIFVTDICIKEPLLSYIDNESLLKDRIVVLDHHKSEIEEGNDKYSFVNITISNDLGKTCGTSLFYNYLKDNNLLKTNDTLDELVELTRQYDTWEWADIYNNIKAKCLHILFEKTSISEYIEDMYKLIKLDRGIKFNEKQLNTIDSFENELKKSISDSLNKMVVYLFKYNDIEYRVGYIRTLYKYRNEFSDIIIKNNTNDIDLIGMIMSDTDTVSYRKVKDVDVSIVSVYFGGKGHKEAGSNPQNNYLFQTIINMIKE